MISLETKRAILLNVVRLATNMIIEVTGNYAADVGENVRLHLRHAISNLEEAKQTIVDSEANAELIDQLKQRKKK